jgi:hypothetical protein
VTLWAKAENGQVKVTATSGPVSITITEHPAHVRHFWGQLGQVLEDLDSHPGPGGRDGQEERTG